jgi:hypothetical protein
LPEELPDISGSLTALLRVTETEGRANVTKKVGQ